MVALSHRRFFPVSLALAACGLLATSTVLLRPLQKSPVQAVAPVAPEVLAQTRVVARGRLEPEAGMVRVAAPMGATLASLQVKEGDSVQPGQVLAHLHQHGEMLARLKLAQSQVEALEAQIKTDQQLNQISVRQAESQIQQIDRPQALQINAQEAVVRRLELAKKQAELSRDRYRQLHQAGAVSQQEMDQTQLSLKQVAEELSQAKATLEQLITARDASLKTAQENVKQVSAQSALIANGLATAQQEAALAAAQLEQTIIRAQQPGQILQILARPGEAVGNQGILTLGNTAQMIAVAEVFETDVSQIRVGQLARITSPALEKGLTGRVIQIGQLVSKNDLLADDPLAKTNARVVEVKVRLDQSKAVAQLSQMQVDVEIDLATESR